MTDERTSGRQPVTIVELDQDFCSLTYGEAPCTAELGVTGEAKCFHGCANCQDVDNYAPEPRTIRFAMPMEDLPRDVVLIPSVISVSTVPGEINVGGGSRDVGLLGSRAKVTVKLDDHPYHDRLLDPYVDERDYDAMERGTFWSKWLARNPYYLGRALRVREGYLGQALEDMQTRHYVIENIDGPTKGVVTIQAKDPLVLLDSDRAVAPFASTGALSLGILANATSLTLTPTGVGNAEYPASGIALMGGELVSYTRSGDTVTLTGRGLRGTEATAHNSGDTFQQVLVLTNEPLVDFLYDLVTVYANVDPAFVPYADWVAEANQWLGGFVLNAWIASPEGVKDLVNDLLDQSTIYIWWDEYEQEIKLRANRQLIAGLDPTPPDVNADANILADSVTITKREDERVSQVWVYYDMINPTVSPRDVVNYRRRVVRRDAEAEGPDQYGDQRIAAIFARFTDATGAAAATVVAARRLARYRDAPTSVEFSVDAKDRGTVLLGESVAFTHPDLVDFSGSPRPRRVQVVRREEVDPGHEVACKGVVSESASVVITRAAFITPNNYPPFDEASEVQLGFGAWISEDSGLMPDGSEGYKIV